MQLAHLNTLAGLFQGLLGRVLGSIEDGHRFPLFFLVFAFLHQRMLLMAGSDLILFGREICGVFRLGVAQLLSRREFGIGEIILQATTLLGKILGQLVERGLRFLFGGGKFRGECRRQTCFFRGTRIGQLLQTLHQLQFAAGGKLHVGHAVTALLRIRLLFVTFAFHAPD